MCIPRYTLYGEILVTREDLVDQEQTGEALSRMTCKRQDSPGLGRNWNSSESSWLCCYKGRQCTSQHLLSNRGPLNFGYGFGERGFGRVSAIAISERWFQYATVDRQPYCLGCHRSGSGFVIWLLSCCPSASGHALNMLVGLYSQILAESVLILFAVCIGWNSWGQQLVVQSNYH